MPAELFPGRPLAGKVLLDSHKEYPVDGILIRLCGMERGINANWRRNTILFREQVRDPWTIAAGSTEIPFQFELPADLPATHHGSLVDIRYHLDARLLVSWRFDPVARAQPFIRPRSPTEVKDQPQLERAGDPADPDLEVRLLTSTARAGGVLHGAAAVKSARPPGLIRVRLRCIESLFDRPGKVALTIDSYDVESVHMALNVVGPQVIPFKVKIPEVGPLSQRRDSFEIAWVIEVSTYGRGRRPRVTLPITVVDHRVAIRPTEVSAPMLIGPERNYDHWRKAGRELGLRYDGAALRGQVERCSIIISQELLGVEGLRLVGKVRYPRLGLGLEVARNQLWFGERDVRLGAPGTWDDEHQVACRDPLQIGRFGALIAESLAAIGPVTMTDTELTTTGAPALGKLIDFGEPLVRFARQLAVARRAIRAPRATARASSDWEALASSLDAELCRGDMSIECSVGAMRGEIRTEWTAATAKHPSVPVCTVVQIHPDRPIDSRFHFEAYEPIVERPAPLESIPVSDPEVVRALEAADSVVIDRDGIRITLPSPPRQVRALSGRLRRLHDLAAAMLRPAMGYR